MKNSIRLASGLMLLVLLFLSTVSCKKDNNTSNSPIVGSWLMYQGADDDNSNGKIEDSEWRVFTKDDYELIKSLGFTGEVVFNGDGTAKLIPTTGAAEVFKWSTKADGTFQIEDTNATSTLFSSDPSDIDKLYIDSNGDLRDESVRNVTSLGVVTVVASGLKFKKN